MHKKEQISNKSLNEIFNFDPAICLYIDLVTYNIKPSLLERSVQVLVKQIVQEDKRIKKVGLKIQNLCDAYLINSVSEFITLYMFDNFCCPIKSQYLN